MDKPDKFQYIAERCREKTGRRISDSGDYYGRHWERPVCKIEDPEVLVHFWGSVKPVVKAEATPADVDVEVGTEQVVAVPSVIAKEDPVAASRDFFKLIGYEEDDAKTEITTSPTVEHYLSKLFDVDWDMERAFDEFSNTEQYAEEPWDDVLEAFMEERLYVLDSGPNNTYNDSDYGLTQVMVVRIYNPVANPSRESIYPNHDGTTRTVARIHTGCDVMSGYAKPLFLIPLGEYAYPVDTNADFYAVKVLDDKLQVIEGDTDQGRYDKYRAGYSTNPGHWLHEDAEFFVDVSKTEGHGMFWVKFNNVDEYPEQGTYALMQACSPAWE